MLQTPTTQLLAGEVLPGFLQAPNDYRVSQELVRLRAAPFAARQDSRTHHEPDQLCCQAVACCRVGCSPHLGSSDSSACPRDSISSMLGDML